MSLPYPFTLGPDSIVHGPVPAPIKVRSPRVHFMGGDDAYAVTQTSDEIADGDVLVLPGVVGVLVGAWPVAVKGDGERYGFHGLREDADIANLGAYVFGRRFECSFGIDQSKPEPGNDYTESFRVARALADA